MMKTWLLVGTLALAACGSDDDDGGPTRTPDVGSGCGDVRGNYSVKVSKLSGDCPAGDGAPVTLAITTFNGALNVAIPGIEGGCPADMNQETCRLTAACKVGDYALFNLDYTFQGTTLTGTIAGSLSPPAADPACNITSRHEGTRL